MNPQSSIAHYRITAKLGEGGMGAVYRATDTKLGREVAIKVLPEAFAADPDRLARFTREAQVLASLNHPNIAAIYGVEDRALVMELVEGPTLAERIAEGPIPLEEALAIARQIGDALEAAHERNVVHRDLKPANIKITLEGRVKVLDFGLAKALSNNAPAPTGDGVNSPTRTMRSTVLGIILGTAGYMAPEQAKGKPVDKRADIWSFGVVLYEMLTGEALFAGDTVSDTLAAVLTKEPDWQRVPNKVERLLKSCLEKEPKRRLRDIGDAWKLVEDERGTGVPRPDKARPTGVALALVSMFIATVGISGWWRATRPVDHPLTRLSVDLGREAMIGLSTTVAISPDGRRLVFPARGPEGKQQLATRPLDQAQLTLLPGTDGGTDPFFSPDGQWVGFFAGARVKKISVQGGAPVTLASNNYPRGGSWGEDGNIVITFGSVQPLSRSLTGGHRCYPVDRPFCSQLRPASR
jgi:serine/threonine-protein kinase